MGLLSFQLHAAIDVATSEAGLNVTSEAWLAGSATYQQDPTVLTFSKNTHTEISQGYSNSDLWMRFDFTNSSGQTQTKLLYFDAPLMGKLTAYESSMAGTVATAESGPGLALQDRSVPVRWGAFKISLAPHTEKVVFIKRSSHHALNTQAYVADESYFSHIEAQAKAIFFFYLGGICCLILYNIVLGVSTRQKDYVVYSAFAASFAFVALS